MPNLTMRKPTDCDDAVKILSNDSGMQAATSQGAAKLLFTFGDDRQMFKVLNATDQDMWLCWATTGNKFDYLQAGAAQTYDLGGDDEVISSGAKLYGFFPGGTPANDTSHFIVVSMVC